MFADPQVRHLGIATPLPGDSAPSVLASAISLSGVSKAVRLPVPAASQHTAEVLAEAGYSAEEIAAMRQAGAVR